MLVIYLSYLVRNKSGESYMNEKKNNYFGKFGTDKKSLLLSLFCLILMFIFTFSLTQTSQAMEENMTRERELQKGDTVEGTHVFAMPDNGWNTVSIKLDYYESYYSENNTTNTFPFRQKMYVIK